MSLSVFFLKNAQSTSVLDSQSHLNLFFLLFFKNWETLLRLSLRKNIYNDAMLTWWCVCRPKDLYALCNADLMCLQAKRPVCTCTVCFPTSWCRMMGRSQRTATCAALPPVWTRPSTWLTAASPTRSMSSGSPWCLACQFALDLSLALVIVSFFFFVCHCFILFFVCKL